MFQFSLELNFVKIACRRRRSVPTKQQLPRRWFTDSQFLTISSESASKGRVGARCAPSCPGPEQMCPGFGPSSPWLCHSHPQQPQCGRTLSFGKKKPAFPERWIRNLGSGMQHKSNQPPRVLQFHSVLTGTVSFAGFAQHHFLKPV